MLLKNNEEFKKVYETERLMLKVLDESDAAPVLEYFLRNRAFLSEWEPVREESFYTIETQERFLKADFENTLKRNCLRLWILIKDDEDNSRVIGTVGFSNIVRGAFLSCHLGYKLDGEEVNKGYICEAISKGIEIVFKEYGLHRIEANIMPKNKRSLRVVEKLGFYNEGLAKKYLRINGVWEDHIHMVLRNEDME